MRSSASSKADSAASASPDPAKASMSAGVNSVSTSRARGLRTAGSPAEVPAANGLGRGFRPLKAESSQRGQRLRIVGDAGEDETARDGAERRRVLEQPRIMLLDLGEVTGEVCGESHRAGRSRRIWRSA